MKLRIKTQENGFNVHRFGFIGRIILCHYCFNMISGTWAPWLARIKPSLEVKFSRIWGRMSATKRQMLATKSPNSLGGRLSGPFREITCSRAKCWRGSEWIDSPPCTPIGALSVNFIEDFVQRSRLTTLQDPACLKIKAARPCNASWFCVCAENKIDLDADFHRNILFSNEAHS